MFGKSHRGISEALLVNINAAPTKMFHLRLVPRMCHRLGVGVLFEENEWNEFLKRAAVGKPLAELKAARAGGVEMEKQTQESSPPPSLCQSDTLSVGSASSSRMLASSEVEGARSGEETRLRAENEALKRRLGFCNVKINAQKSQIHRLRAKQAKLQESARKKQNESDNMEVSKTSKVRNLTCSGAMAVGLRMCLSSCSALSFPRAAWVDISRQTVARREIQVAAATLIRARLVAFLVFHRAIFASRAIPVTELVYQQNQEEPPHLFGTQHIYNFKSCKPYLPEFLHQDAQRNLSGDEQKAIQNAFIGLHALVSELPPPTLQGSNEKRLFIAGLSLQNDATNSEVWRKKKLTSMVVSIGTLIDIQSLADLQYDKAFYTDQFMFLGDRDTNDTGQRQTNNGNGKTVTVSKNKHPLLC